jgi:SAM-dependent methyltransferase
VPEPVRREDAVVTRDGTSLDVEYFNRFGEGYTPYSDADLELITRPLLEVLTTERQWRICEIGCASGQFSSELAARLPGRRATFLGIDIAVQPLRRYPFGRVCGSALQMPVAAGAFDLVCCPASLHHLTPLPTIVAEIARVLAPGGYLYCLEPNFFHPQRRWFMRFTRLYRLYRAANDVPINPDELTELLRTSTLDVVRQRFVNLEFRHPGVLQRMQNRVASAVPRSRLDRFLLPWFMTLARKRDEQSRR